jgi:predicted nuclease of predicted toxin-antitoxin system
MPTLNLLADENVDQQIIDLLRREGHTVTYVAELDPGIDDEQVLERANEASALLLTADRDFGELVFRQHRLSGGVILFRLSGIASETKARLIASVLTDHSAELAGGFTVISPGLVRIRPHL